ncbi:MAG: hypothetical protein IJ291_00285 [Lachnospiraceae bacterium]|nr:hypothetical protein [Lachnospiraceae bacterium]
MIETLKKMMKDCYGIEDLRGDANFKKDFGLSSFDFVNLVCMLEEDFNIEIDEKDYRALNTVDELIAYLEKKAACSQ